MENYNLNFRIVRYFGNFDGYWCQRLQELGHLSMSLSSVNPYLDLK